MSNIDKKAVHKVLGFTFQTLYKCQDEISMYLRVHKYSWIRQLWHENCMHENLIVMLISCHFQF